MLTARRWTRYGHDRVYVSLDDGTRVGMLDLKTGKTTIDLPEWTEAFHDVTGPYLRSAMSDAIDDLLRTQGNTTPIPRPAEHPSLDADPTPTDPQPVRPPGGDLADHVAGQAARSQADEHLARMRKRSRVLTFLARTFDAKTDERAWRVGAVGEERVGERLEPLRELGWRVLHSIPVGSRGSDIDHLLIGPGGVFTINTKYHPGARIWVSPRQLRVNGQPVPYLRNSRFEAARAGDLLAARVGWPVIARGALVLLTGRFSSDVTIKGGEPEGVWILGRADVPRRFARSTAILSTDEVDELFAAARKPDTWTKAH